MNHPQDDVSDFFLNEKPVQLLVKLRDYRSDNYASALARQADVTYSHTVKCLQRMEKHGMVRFERKGRKKEIELTDYGDEVADEFFQLLDCFTEDS